MCVYVCAMWFLVMPVFYWRISNYTSNLCKLEKNVHGQTGRVNWHIYLRVFFFLCAIFLYDSKIENNGTRNVFFVIFLWQFGQNEANRKYIYITSFELGNIFVIWNFLEWKHCIMYKSKCRMSISKKKKNEVV